MLFIWLFIFGLVCWVFCLFVVLKHNVCNACSVSEIILHRNEVHVGLQQRITGKGASQRWQIRKAQRNQQDPPSPKAKHRAELVLQVSTKPHLSTDNTLIQHCLFLILQPFSEKCQHSPRNHQYSMPSITVCISVKNGNILTFMSKQFFINRINKRNKPYLPPTLS